MNFENPAWRSRPLRTSLRVFASLVRRAVPVLRTPSVGYDEGRARIVADLNTALGLRLYRYGHADSDVELVRRLLRPGDVFIDGGANVGLFTLVAASRVGSTGLVISFEPASTTRRILSRNIDLNNFEWVRIRNEALDERVGVRRFVSLRGDFAGLSSFHPAGGPSPDATTVENVSVIALDEVLTEPEKSRLALIKLDLEGAEYGALLGARQLLADIGPDFLIEVEPGHLERHGASAGKVVEVFSAAGYDFYRPRPGSDGRVELAREFEPTRTSERPNLFVTKDVGRARRAGITICP